MSNYILLISVWCIHVLFLFNFVFKKQNDAVSRHCIPFPFSKKILQQKDVS